MSFKNRRDAGERLGLALAGYRAAHPIVLAIPKGGVEVAYYVARALDAPLSVLVARKLPFPDNPESGFGAVAEDGTVFMYSEAGEWLDLEIIEGILRTQMAEIARRVELFRRNAPPPPMKGRTVILVDDGLAMGSTMRAAIGMCRNLGAKRIVVGVPVAGAATASEIGSLADDIVVLKTPPRFHAVAQAYGEWHDASDEEVLALLEGYKEAPTHAG